MQAAQQKDVLVNHDVKVEVVDGAEMVEIPDDLLVNTVPLWEDFLEGKYLDPAPHVARIHIIVNKIDVFAVNERTVKFRIRDQQTTTEPESEISAETEEGNWLTVSSGKVGEIKC